MSKTLVESKTPKKNSRDESQDLELPLFESPASKVELAKPVLPVEPAPVKAPGSEPKPAATSASRHLVVSVHDVSPLTRPAVERVLAELAELGVRGVSLLVIPDHHCKGHILDHPDFCAWLRERETLGDELVIHGYTHRRDQKPNETLKDKLTTRYYTAGEGEFFDISGADALRIVSQARQEFRKVGLEPRGFIAPAWLLSDGADRALQRLGIAYTTRIGSVFDYTTGINYTSQSLVWSTRSWLRRAISRWWNARLFHQLRTRPLLRIGIHPPDIEHRAVWQQVKTLIAKALEDRVPVTYAGFLKPR